MIPERVRLTKGRLPERSGVYLMYDSRGALLYVGKAANLRRRVTSYFSRANDARIERLVAEIRRIDYRETDTAIEALMLEAELIKKYRPPYNVKEKDDKSFLFVVITKEDFPRILLVRGKDIRQEGLALSRAEGFGPFTSASSIREALRILRRIFPWSEHSKDIRYEKRDIRKIARDEGGEIRNKKKPCFDYEVGLCPGTCAGLVTKTAYAKTISRVRAIFRGRKKDVIRSLEREMRAESTALRFEEAEALRRKLIALGHIQDVALIHDDKVFPPAAVSARPFRIEGYDISNTSGKNAVGSMVVFEDGEPKREDYRKFRVKGVSGPDDFAMLEEVLTRRLAHLPPKGVYPEQSRRVYPGPGRKEIWPKPDLILVDGGAGQLTAAKRAFRAAGVSGIRLIGMVKGPDRKRTDIIGIVPAGVARETLVRVRDEAHRFAIGYHRALRKADFLPGR